MSSPEDFDFDRLAGLPLNELKQKLLKTRPYDVAQASRIDGISPAAAISLLLVHLRRGRRGIDCNPLFESPRMELNGRRVSRETQERLEHFVDLFQKWSKAINLSAPSTRSRTRGIGHVADSAQIFQPCRWQRTGSISVAAAAFRASTAIFLAELNGGWVHLVESNNKKAAFLVHRAQGNGSPWFRASSADRRCGCRPAGLRLRLGPCLCRPDKPLEFVQPFAIRNEKIRAYFHKGRDYRSEVAKAHGRWTFDLVEHGSAVEVDSVVLEISHLSAFGLTTSAA